MSHKVSAPVPPQNLDAEESVIGAMMLAPGAIEKVVGEGLKPSDFYRESHAKMYSAAVELFTNGTPVDAITLSDKLEKDGMLEAVGGRPRVHELAALVPASSNAPHYARLVRDMAGLRSLIRAGGEIARLGWERPGELTELIAQAEGALTKAVERSNGHKAVALADGIDEMIAEIREAYTSGIAISGELAGFRDLDEVLSGLWPGQLILLAARPSNGKSTFALNVAENFADRGVAVLFETLEMSEYELRIRSLARAARVNSRVLASGQMSKPDADKLPAAIEKVKGRTKLFIQDSGGTNVATIKAEAQRLKRTDDLGLIVVDYLQLMSGDGRISRNEQIAEISRGLKLLARDLNVPLLALSQMNRGIENRHDKRPTLADLRDSGALEQDADVVMFLHDEAAYDPDKEPDGTIEIIVAKNRRGENTTVKLAYNRAWSSFKNLGGST